MSIIEKRILKNRPIPLASGQYAYEVLPSGVEINLGSEDETSKFNTGTELYTLCDDEYNNIQLIQNNINDDCAGSSLSISELIMKK